jgi:pimeloyl-ACP methyl ester carboxylesterase
MMSAPAYLDPSKRKLGPPAFLRELARRIDLAREPLPAGKPPAPQFIRLAGELSYLAEPVLRRWRGETIEVSPAAIPRKVMLLPGFGAHPLRMRYFARQLEKAGHKVKRWGLGFNFGASADKLDRIEARLLQLHQRYGGEQLVLVGWSLGGVFAREVAKRHPDKVSKVITMGSPFSGDPRANNAWRVYQAVAGHRVDEPPIAVRPHEKPPVETVALWSALDGVVHPRSACGRPGERDRAHALRCKHMGFVYAKESIETVLAELDWH